MIKLYKANLYLILCSIVMFSCNPDDGPAHFLDLSFQSGPEYVSEDTRLPLASPFKVALEVNPNTDIESIKVRVSYNGGALEIPANCTTCDLSAANFESVGLDYYGGTAIFNFTTKPTMGKELWTFEATTAGSGYVTEKVEFTITNTGGELFSYPVDTSKTFQLWNVRSEDVSHIDLIENTTFSSNQDLTIADLTYVTNDDDENVTTNLKPSNTTLYKLLTTTTYDQVITEGDLEGLWAANGAELTTLTDVQEGQAYIAKLREQDEYALVTFTKVVSLANNTQDYVELRYKKVD